MIELDKWETALGNAQATLAKYAELQEDIRKFAQEQLVADKEKALEQLSFAVAAQDNASRLECGMEKDRIRVVDELERTQRYYAHMRNVETEDQRHHRAIEDILERGLASIALAVGNGRR